MQTRCRSERSPVRTVLASFLKGGGLESRNSMKGEGLESSNSTVAKKKEVSS